MSLFYSLKEVIFFDILPLQKAGIAASSTANFLSHMLDIKFQQQVYLKSLKIVHTVGSIKILKRFFSNLKDAK